MNDSFDQQSAQTPSPLTGSRQETHSVGSAISSASFAAWFHAVRRAPNAPRNRFDIDRKGAISASMSFRLARPRLDCQRPAANVSTRMASDPNAAPVLFDRTLLAQRQARAARLGPATFLIDRVIEDLDERLAAVNRRFAAVIDIWTPGESVLPCDRFKSASRLAL